MTNETKQFVLCGPVRTFFSHSDIFPNQVIVIPIKSLESNNLLHVDSFWTHHALAMIWSIHRVCWSNVYESKVLIAIAGQPLSGGPLSRGLGSPSILLVGDFLEDVLYSDFNRGNLNAPEVKFESNESFFRQHVAQANALFKKKGLVRCRRWIESTATKERGITLQSVRNGSAWPSHTLFVACSYGTHLYQIYLRLMNCIYTVCIWVPCNTSSRWTNETFKRLQTLIWPQTFSFNEPKDHWNNILFLERAAAKNISGHVYPKKTSWFKTSAPKTVAIQASLQVLTSSCAKK